MPTRTAGMTTVWLLATVILAVTAGVGAFADVTYALGPETELLDAAFYAGQPEDGSNIAGRMAYMGGTSHGGNTVAFIAVNRATANMAFFLVTLGDSSSWRRLTGDYPLQGVAPMRWTQDDSHLIVHDLLISATTGDFVQMRPFGIMPRYSSLTQLPDNNWMAAGQVYYGWNIVMYPMLPNGQIDLSRDYVVITDWRDTVPNAGPWPSISPDGDTITFEDPMTSQTPGVPDTGDIYVLRNVQQILAAPKKPGTNISSLAPTSLNDPNVIAIRTSESAHFTGAPDFSEDASLVFYSEDFNSQFRFEDFLNTLALSDFDIMISNVDGSGEDIRLANAGNQLFMMPSPGGTRIVYTRDVGSVLHLFATTLIISSSVNGDPVGDPAENDLLTLEPQEVSDASKTTLAVSADTLIDFPPGAPQRIEVSTPLEPVIAPQLPPDVDGIPTLREFGPPGTTFDTPVTVTISYTDAEVVGMDEAELRIFSYNSVSGIFDIEITTIVARDLINNTISFTLDHFSLYGVGGGQDMDMDGIPDSEDPDDDNDGIVDADDSMPFDTDNDGWDNPVDPDDDNDGLSDLEEIGVYNTDPLLADTDGGGADDAFEVQWDYDPLNPDETPTLPVSGFFSLFLAGLGCGIAGMLKIRRSGSSESRN